MWKWDNNLFPVSILGYRKQHPTPEGMRWKVSIKSSQYVSYSDTVNLVYNYRKNISGTKCKITNFMYEVSVWWSYTVSRWKNRFQLLGLTFYGPWVTPLQDLTHTNFIHLSYSLFSPHGEYTVKNGCRFSRPQPGCHKPDLLWLGIIYYSQPGRVWLVYRSCIALFIERGCLSKTEIDE